MWLGTAQGSVCQARVCTPDLGMQAKPTVSCMITLDAGRCHSSKPASQPRQTGFASFAATSRSQSASGHQSPELISAFGRHQQICLPLAQHADRSSMSLQSSVLASQSKATQLAHDGPVSEIVTMSDRVVSTGGARAVTSIMREWSLTGELIASHTPCKQGTFKYMHDYTAAICITVCATYEVYISLHSLVWLRLPVTIMFTWCFASMSALCWCTTLQLKQI